MGFIGYRRSREGDSDEIVRVFLECREESTAAGPATGLSKGFPEVSYTYAVEVVFPDGKSPCHLRGVDGIGVLKKFYKLIFSLEERAREHGNDWRSVMESPQRLLEHLRYTRNAREFTASHEPRRSPGSEEIAEPDCVKAP